MIAQLSGKLVSKTPTQSVIDCHGVGYEVFHTPFTAEKLSEDHVTLHVHTHVREDAFQLFGFFTQSERALFRELLKVSGIGPKLALSILSGIPFEELIAALSSKDLSRLQKIPGVGKKTAERLAVEVSERVREWEISPAIGDRVAAAAPGDGSREAELESVLLNLGYFRPEIQRTVKKLKTQFETFQTEPLESLVKTALRELTTRAV